MRAPRFERGFAQRPATRWTRLSDLSAPRISKRKKFFAIVSPPIRIDTCRNPIRRVLIYDNHPATLRLFHDVDAAERREKHRQILFGVTLAVIVVLVISFALL